MNRLHKFVVFHPLKPEELDEVLESELGNVEKRMLVFHNAACFNLAGLAGSQQIPPKSHEPIAAPLGPLNAKSTRVQWSLTGVRSSWTDNGIYGSPVVLVPRNAVTGHL